MTLSPREREWVDRGIFARGTKGGRKKYGVSYTLPPAVAAKYKVSRRRREIAGYTITAARRRLALRQTQIADGDFSFLAPQKPEIACTLRSFAERYLESVRTTKRSHGFDAARLKAILTDKAIADVPLDEISHMAIDRYRSRRAGEVSPKTVNHELQVLGRVLKVARRWGQMKADPMDGIQRLKVQKHPPRVASDDELRALVSASAPHLRAFILIAVNTGLRMGEILALRGSDVDLERGFLVVRKSKNYQNRTVPMNATARDILTRLVHLNRPVIQYEGRAILDVKMAWSRACRRSGVTGLTTHSLRHTFATRWMERGGDLVALRDVLGHSDIRETMVYAHPTPEGALRGVRAAEFAFETGPLDGPPKATGRKPKLPTR